MELYVLVLKIMLFYCISIPVVGILAACCKENLQEKKELIKKIREEKEKLLCLKRKEEKKEYVNNLKVKVRNLHLQNKKLRKVLHETRVEKNNYKKKGKQCASFLLKKK
jgi:hypothetical protein